MFKLSQLTKVGKVFRGVSGYLPDAFWSPNDSGSVGGVEVAFVSTSMDQQTAQASTGSEYAIVLEIDMGMLGRGADISWLSMYPDEQEVVFPPLSAFEVVRTTVDGAVFLVTLRPTVNRDQRPIELTIAKMQASVLQLVDSLRSELRLAGAPNVALHPFERLELKIRANEPSWYNHPSQYVATTQEAMDAQREVLSLLVDGEIWKSKAARHGGDGRMKERVMTVAEVCARMHAHETCAESVIRV